MLSVVKFQTHCSVGSCTVLINTYVLVLTLLCSSASVKVSQAKRLVVLPTRHSSLYYFTNYVAFKLADPAFCKARGEAAAVLTRGVI
jgi:hypothetical protein